MKKILALLAVVLGVVSCQTEPEGLDVNVGGEQEVAVCVSLPEATRAADSAEGAFKNVDLENEFTIRYILQVYYNGQPSKERLVKYSDDKSVVFPVRLVPGRDYNFVVWADIVEDGNYADNQWSNEDGLHYNTTDLHNITLKQTWVAMDETRDAFTGYYNTADHNVKYSSTLPINITLKRPFAKLRVITTDMVELGYLGIEPYKGTVKYTTKHRESFNACNGTYGEQTKENVELVYNIAQYADNNEHNMVLFTDYFFADNDVVKFTMDIKEANNESIKKNNFNTDIAVQRNYLTTIQGNILTDGNNVTVTVEDAFKDKTEWPEKGNSAEELAFAAMFGGEVTLTDNITLTQPLTIVEGANVVIDLGGKTITTGLKQEGRHHYAIDNYGTLTLKGEGAINARGVENFGTMTIDGNITITNVDTNGGSAIWNEGDLVINGGTFTTNAEAGVGSYGTALSTQEGGSAVINGGNFTAYSQLSYAICNYGETVINNATVKGKHGAVAAADDPAYKTTINGGSFELMENPGVSDHCAYYVSEIKGGKFTLGNNTDCGAQVFYSSTIAAGYKAVEAGGLYYVLPEIIANAAEAAGVTAVTESTADVATALATKNGEVALFMWNDVAYIAKYGEVIITSAADEATTVRGVVESAAGLTSATVADGIEVVGNRTFRKCANLKTVALPNTLTEIGPGVFQSCSKLANITIPESVTTIGEQAFAECSSLESINIPAGVTRIEADALRATGLVSVEFHEGVTYFGAQAFRDCKQLKEVIIKAPVFTVEANAFGVMAGTLPGTKIYVANAEMKAYLESTLTYKNQFEVVVPNSVSTAEELTEALANRENVVLTQDVTTEAATTAPYGNKYAFKLDGGVIDGNGHELHMECYGDDYGIMTSGGTIKNVTIKEGCRAVMIMCPQTDVILDNVEIGGDGVLYPINTGEAGAEGVNLVVTNSVLAGWTSYGLIESATFTNVEFKQGTYYNNIYGRVLKPYVNTTLTNCSFVKHMNLDLSELKAGHKIVMKNCKVNGQAVTAATFTVPTTNAQYDTELFTIDLPSWASSINDCVVFE